MTENKVKRCAVYCRKSTDIGLEQDYNSLDAQRESAENFIKSQKNNGWELLPEHYDDGGFSGSNTDRPALKRLMADVEAGKIEIIVLYKLDRLSRSLLDFMKMAEFFERHNVSFVSVTQDINTSTSSGRMMLNILMTFSEFERAVITERILDRVAGKKRRGKYCGGCPVMGYDVDSDTKKLLINKKEAKTITEIFKTYSKLASGREVAKLLNEKGIHTKSWVSKKGVHHTGMKFSPKGVYRILNNPLYIGKVQHKGNIYEGEQDAIIPQSLWDKVQNLLAQNNPIDSRDQRYEINSPFKGLLYCGYCGGAFGITYAKKNGRRYMYYICIKDEARAEHQCPLRRFSTGNLDRIILNQLSRMFKSPALLSKTFKKIEAEKKVEQGKVLAHQKELETQRDAIRDKINAGGDMTELRAQHTELDNQLEEVKRELKKIGEIYSTSDLLETCDSIEAIWEQLFPAERYNLAHLLIDRVTLFSDHILIDVNHYGIRSLIRDLKSSGSGTESLPTENNKIIRLKIPAIIKHWNGRKLIITPDASDEKDTCTIDGKVNSVAKRLAQAHRWLGMIESGEYPTVARLAEGLNLDPSNLMKALKMTTLSPTIQEMIISGNVPNTMTLTKFYSDFPEDWEEQEHHFGMSEETVS